MLSTTIATEGVLIPTEQKPETFGSRLFTHEEKVVTKRLLDQDLGEEHLASRKGAGRDNFTYIEGWKGVELANSIFGYDGWSCSIVDLTPDYIEKSKGDKYAVAVTAVVKIVLRDGTFHEDVGTGFAEDRNRGNAIDRAKKEAVTDARKRALRQFGRSLGGCVYEKDFLSSVKPGAGAVGELSYDGLREDSNISLNKKQKLSHDTKALQATGPTGNNDHPFNENNPNVVPSNVAPPKPNQHTSPYKPNVAAIPAKPGNFPAKPPVGINSMGKPNYNNGTNNTNNNNNGTSNINNVRGNPGSNTNSVAQQPPHAPPVYAQFDDFDDGMVPYVDNTLDNTVIDSLFAAMDSVQNAMQPPQVQQAQMPQAQMPQAQMQQPQMPQVSPQYPPPQYNPSPPKNQPQYQQPPKYPVPPQSQNPPPQYPPQPYNTPQYNPLPPQSKPPMLQYPVPNNANPAPQPLYNNSQQTNSDGHALPKFGNSPNNPLPPSSQYSQSSSPLINCSPGNTPSPPANNNNFNSNNNNNNNYNNNNTKTPPSPSPPQYKGSTPPDKKNVNTVDVNA